MEKKNLVFLATLPLMEREMMQSMTKATHSLSYRENVIATSLSILTLLICTPLKAHTLLEHHYASLHR